MTWTDDAGIESSNSVLFFTSSALPPIGWGSTGGQQNVPGSVNVFEAVAGVPVTFSIYKGADDNANISFWWIVEALQ